MDYCNFGGKCDKCPNDCDAEVGELLFGFVGKIAKDSGLLICQNPLNKVKEIVKEAFLSIDEKFIKDLRKNNEKTNKKCYNFIYGRIREKCLGADPSIVEKSINEEMQKII